MFVIKVDYFERAKRIVELPKLEKHSQQQLEADRQFHAEQEEQKVSQSSRWKS